MNLTTGNLHSASFVVKGTVDGYVIDATINVDENKSVINISNGHVKESETSPDLASFSSYMTNQLTMSIGNTSFGVTSISQAVEEYCASVRNEVPTLNLTF